MLSNQKLSNEINQLTLISHTLCPYVQRSVIALNELGLPYKRIDVNLNSPPEWFLKLSPLGKVPVLVVDDDVVLFESSVIAQYINEIAKGNLLSNEPLKKAHEKAWMEFASATLDNIGQAYSAESKTSFLETVRLLDSKWGQLEKNLSTKAFFTGKKFSLVDSAFAPVFRYLDLFELIVDIEFLKYYPKVAAWRSALNKRESVINAVSLDYQTLLGEFIADRHSYLAKKTTIMLQKHKTVEPNSVSPRD